MTNCSSSTLASHPNAYVSVATINLSSDQTIVKNLVGYNISEIPQEEILYEIGSVTKTFTGLGLAVAADHQLVNLGTTVQSLFPQGST